jgi:hypothetical protein
VVWQIDEFYCLEVYYYIIYSGINIGIILEVIWYAILSWLLQWYALLLRIGLVL